MLCAPHGPPGRRIDFTLKATMPDPSQRDSETVISPIASDLSANARRVMEARYLRRDEHRQVIETPHQLFARAAEAVAGAECLLGYDSAFRFWRDEFHRMLAALEFLPNSPTLMNAGTTVGQLSACFVLPVPDTMEGIFDAMKQMALVQHTGGGTGFSFSRLRPRGDLVSSTGGEASGPVSFLRIFDCATESIKQGGRRRGANMGVLRVDHPDILEFIHAKRDGRSLHNFNLSVDMTDAFMQAVEDDERFPLRHPGSGHAVDTLPARRVFDAIVDAAWQTGDPGIHFLDAINRADPTPQLGEIETTNPCGELPLLPYEACNLGSINLARMLREAKGSGARSATPARTGSWDVADQAVGAPMEVHWEKLAATKKEKTSDRWLTTAGAQLQRGHSVILGAIVARREHRERFGGRGGKSGIMWLWKTGRAAGKPISDLATARNDKHFQCGFKSGMRRMSN